MTGYLIALYLIPLALIVIIALIFFLAEGPVKNKIGARMILVAPVWPLLLPLYFTRFVKYLWKSADWKGVEEEERIIREQRHGRY